MRVGRRFRSALLLATALLLLPHEGQAGLATSCEARPLLAIEAETGERSQRKTALALSWLVKLSPAGQRNVAVSPFGISQVLATLEVGADGAMKAAIADTLKLDKRNRATEMDDLRRQARLLSVIGGRPNAPFASADALFVDRRQRLQPEVEERVQSEAGALVERIEFDKPGAIDAVNRWAKERTGGRIDTILEPGSPPSLVAVNALAFKDCWRIPFDPQMTQARPFTRLDGSAVTPATMHLQNETLAFRKTGRFAAVELRYADDRFALTLVTTTDKPAAASAFAAADELLAGGGLKSGPVRLALPKFSANGEHDLLGPLSQMGLAAGLASKTQLEGFGPGLSLSAVKQKVFIKASEEGTEAAAATAAVITRSAAPVSPTLISLDKPFVYALRHRSTGTVLMIGYVGDPS